MASSNTSATSFETELVEFIRARGNPSGSKHDYPFPSHVNPAGFVSIKLVSEANYGRWMEQIKCLLECYGMLDFINGKLRCPVEDYEEWKRSDTLVKGWIFGSLSEDVMETVVGFQTAYDVFQELKTTYGTPPAPMQVPASRSNIPTTIQKDTAEYLPLYRAIMNNDWEKAERIFNHDPDALGARITGTGDTPLHVAIGKVKSIEFVKNLLEEINPRLLPYMVNDHKVNPLLRAANCDNKMAAEMLVNKNPHLLFIYDGKELLPIHRAVINSHITTFRYLLDACEQHIELCQLHGYESPFESTNGAILLTSAIISGFLDVSYELIIKYPDLAREMVQHLSPLSAIAGKWDSYYSGTRYSYYQNFVYSCVPSDINLLSDTNTIQDIENQETSHANLITNSTKSCLYSDISGFCIKFWKIALVYVLHIKHLHEEKVKHHAALLILKRICEEVGKLKKGSEIRAHYKEAIKVAVYNDTSEVIEEIIKYFPQALWTMVDGDFIIQVAIRNRCEKTYNFLVRYLSYDKHELQQWYDKDGNNLLHLVGELAPIHKLNMVSGAALQMQREIQWFQEVENFVKPKYKDLKNNNGDTPIMVFRREHMQLRKDGEEWMKKTADSYTITAALIITIVFAAAITVPGGNDGNSGKAIYERKPSFIIFAIFDAISLFTSTTSLLLFLSILTTRFREEDFLYKLPKRLILGLAMLFLSVTSMMVAFSATLYLMFGQGKAWILIPIATLTCLPIASFVTLQLPLLVDMISSTYGQGIFVKKTDHKVKQS